MINPHEQESLTGQSPNEQIVIRGARVHNLKNIDLDIPRNTLTVITGLSGSGKSSLAFDTIYAEGQRRYIESLSAYARQFLDMMEKPDVDFIDGLSPTISIEQKSASHNPRSTVGTVTEIYDFLRLLYSKTATPFCYSCGRAIQKQSRDQIIDAIIKLGNQTKIQILAPVVRARKGHYKELFEKLRKSGFVRVRIDGEIKELESVTQVARYQMHNIEVVVDRLTLSEKPDQRLIDSVEQALELGDGAITIVATGEKNKSGSEINLSRHYACQSCGISYDEPFPRMFSFNSPYGACPECDGLGVLREFDESLIIPDADLSYNQGAIAPYNNPKTQTWYYLQILGILEKFGFDGDTPIKKLSKKCYTALMQGTESEKHDFYYYSGNRKKNYKGKFLGVAGILKHYYEETTSEQIRSWTEEFMSEKICTACNGGRLNPQARSYQINSVPIHEITQWSLKKAFAFFESVHFPDRLQPIGEPVLKEIRERLGFLLKVGLDYLSLDRTARTLSGGEAQRIRLATQVGSQLVGIVYVLDEPSIGLHHRDNQKLIQSLIQLRDLGNTVIVVEHDRDTMEHADYIVDLGPGAGRLGGEVVVTGTIEKIKE